MAVNVASLLDKAKTVHRLSSDYKLALVMGISPSSLAHYRTGKTLPDTRVISILCGLTGDDPALIAAEVEEMRATSPEARKIWRSISVLISLSRRAGIQDASYQNVESRVVNYRNPDQYPALVSSLLPVMRPSHDPSRRPAPPRSGISRRISRALGLVA